MRVVYICIILSYLISCEKVEVYTLDTIIFPDLSGTLNIYNGTFSPGEEVIIEAYPNEYFEFVSWGGSVSGEDSKVSLVMNENKLIYKNLYNFEFGDDLSVFDKIIQTDGINAEQVLEIAKSTVRELL